MPNELRTWRVVSVALFIPHKQTLSFSSEALLVPPPAFWHFKSNYLPSNAFEVVGQLCLFLPPSPSVQPRRDIEASAAFPVHQRGSESRSLSATAGRMVPQGQPQPQSQPQPMISRAAKPGAPMTRGGDQSVVLLFCFRLCFSLFAAVNSGECLNPAYERVPYHKLRRQVEAEALFVPFRVSVRRWSAQCR
jgi:hypothetical protein